MVTKNTQRLAEVGPIDPQTGFPFWYEDSTGLRLELVWREGDDNAPVVLDQESGTLRGNPFPGEAFYMSAETEFTAGAGNRTARIRVILALEATFGGTGEVMDGQQIVFGRIRFRVRDGLPETAYKLTHPYGTVEGTTDDSGRVTVTEDIGVTPLDFTGALGSSIAPFLRWTPDPDLPPGYVGDGTTEHTVTGSPFGTNFALVEGPRVGAAGNQPDPGDPGNLDKIYTDLFVLQGRIATVNGADVPRAVYTRAGDGTVTTDVFARSITGQQLLVAGAGLPDTPMQGGATRNYVARLDSGSTVPTEVTVTNLTDSSPLPTTAAVTDAVEITQADYDAAARSLTVVATSSDQQTPPALTVIGRGGLSGPVGVLTDVDAPPPVITVESTAGGLSTRSIRVVG